MNTNISKDKTQNIAIYNDSPRVFIHFQMGNLESGDYKINIINLHAPNIDLSGFSINKKYKDFNTISTNLKYYINGKDNKRYATFCIEQSLEELDRDIVDDFTFTFLVKNIKNNTVEMYNVHLYRNFYINGFANRSNSKVINEYNSHMVLRTNPKLSGNIKLVVSPTYDLYLDTFPVTPTLSKKEVRKREVSAVSSYSKDIYSYFSKIPTSDIFNLNDYDTYDISLPKRSYNYQYSTTYNYGARMLNEELYSEKYSILAPLWVNNALPEFFVVFRVDGSHNRETYNNSLSSEELLKKFLREGTIVKSWSLKESTPIGKYLNNHLSELKNIGSNVYISLDSEVNNSWGGIPIKYGVMTELSETTYEFDNIAKPKVDNVENARKSFTEVNNYVTEGFSRNGLVCPNLINLQFNFDDDSTEDYTMHRYFGLYITANDLFKFNYYNGDISNLDKPYSLLDKIKDSNIISKDGDVLFGVVEKDNIKRVTSVNDITQGHKENLVTSNKVSSISKKVDLNKFLSISFDEPIPSGEHFGISCYIDGVETLFEAISVGPSVLSKGEVYKYTHNKDNTHTIAFCVTDDDTIHDSCKALRDAFDVLFKEVVGLSVYLLENKVSVLVSDNKITSCRLRYISSELLTNMSNMLDFIITLDMFEDYNCVDNMRFYGQYKLDRNDATIATLSEMETYGIYGPRLVYFVEFISSSSVNNIYSLEDELIINISSNNVYRYNKKYIKFKNINTLMSYNKKTFDGYTIEHPLSFKKCVVAPTPIDMVMGGITVYTLCDVTFNIFSITQVKDFDFTVYYNRDEFRSMYAYNRGDDIHLNSRQIKEGERYTISKPDCYKVISGGGTMIPSFSVNTTPYAVKMGETPFEFNTFKGSVDILASSDTILCAASINAYDETPYEYDGYDLYGDYSEERLDTYKESKDRLRFGLTTPYVCKWVLQGNDCRSNPLLLKTNRFPFKGNGTYSNFVPVLSDDDSFFNDEFAYPTYTCLNNKSRGVNSYVRYDINDKFSYYGNMLSLKDMYIDNTSNVDVFSKIIYSDFSDMYDSKKTSVLKYNKFYNTITTVFRGVKFTIKLQDNLLPNKTLDGYSFSMVLSNTSNNLSNKPFDLFINNIFKNVLVVWYCNSKEIDYTSRRNSYVNYKNFVTNNDNDMHLNYYTIPKESDKDNPFGIYNYTTANFLLDTSKNVYEIIRMDKYGISSAFDMKIDSATNYLYQESRNVLNEQETYTYIYNGKYNNRYLAKGNFFELYNNFKNADDKILAGLNSYGEYITNRAYIFNTAYNVHKDRVGKIDTFTDLISNPNNIGLFIIDKDYVYTYNTSKLTNTLRINIEKPKLYNNVYTHAGWYTPMFKNILEFNNENYDLFTDVFGMDISFANTRLFKICNIEQLWFYKVKSSIDESDINRGDAIDYRTDFNPMLSQWDDKYYINYDLKDGNDYIKTYIPGFMNPIEESSMFGSKLVKLPKVIELSDWNDITSSVSEYNSTYTEENTDTTKLKLQFNITQSIRDYFFNNKFINNWDGLNTSDIDTTVKNYIDASIIPLYDKLMDDIDVNIYVSDYEGKHILNKKPLKSVKTNKLYSTSLTHEFDNYIYNIIVPRNTLVSYYVEIIIK